MTPEQPSSSAIPSTNPASPPPPHTPTINEEQHGNERSRELVSKFFQQQFRARQGRFKRNPLEDPHDPNKSQTHFDDHQHRKDVEDRKQDE